MFLDLISGGLKENLNSCIILKEEVQPIIKSPTLNTFSSLRIVISNPATPAESQQTKNFFSGFNFSINKWQRGVANFGLATILRSGAQTAEMDKIDGNTKHIYATDRSYRKSFGSVLQDPNNAKLTINRHNTKRGALWHHRISWGNICPMILDSKIYS